jgi:hypothetical protein
MTNRLTPLLVAALLAAPAYAAELDDSLAAGQQAAQNAKGANNSNQARAGRVIANIACVGDADVSAVIDAARDKATIQFAAQTEPSKLTGTTISLDEKLPDYPRVQIAYVVKEAAPLALQSIPDSVEKEYMALSLSVRGWLELGGDGAKLPKLETLDKGYEDVRLGAEYALWMADEKDYLKALRRVSKAKSLQDLLSAAKDKAEEAKVDAAIARWTAFMLAEKDWRTANQGRLQVP